MSKPIFPRATAITTSLFSISSIHHLHSSPPTPPSAVSTAVSILTYHRSKSRWSTLLSLFPQGLTPPQISQILLQIRNNPHLALRFFLFSTQNTPTSLHSYAAIIHILARAHLKSRAKSLIKSAIKEFELVGSEKSEKRIDLFRVLVRTYRVCNSAPFVFDLLVKSYLEMNQLDPCVEIVKLLKSRGILLHVSTCNDLISTALRIKGCFYGYELYKEVFECNFDDSVNFDGRVKQGGHNKLVANTTNLGFEKPLLLDKWLDNREVVVKKSRKLVANVHTFNELLVSFHRNRVVDMLEEIWIEMVKSKCEPDSYSYSILMAAYCDEDEIEKAEKVWEEMRVKGFNYDVVAYNTLIGAYCKKGEVEKGENLYKEMELHNLEGTCITYKHLINGYCLVGNLENALLVYNAMCRKGFELDNSIVDSLIRVLCCKRSVSEALGFFKSATKNDGFIALESSYELLIKGLCKEGKMEEALKFQAQMVGKGCRPNSSVYSAFIDGYMKLGKVHMAESLRKEMMEALV